MKAEFWIKVKGKKNWNGTWAQGQIQVSKSKPSTLPNEVAVKIDLDLPDGLFAAPELRASIKIPADRVNRPAIDAEVQQNIADILMKKTGLEVRVSYEEAPTQ